MRKSFFLDSTDFFNIKIRLLTVKKTNKKMILSAEFIYQYIFFLIFNSLKLLKSDLTVYCTLKEVDNIKKTIKVNFYLIKIKFSFLNFLIGETHKPTSLNTPLNPDGFI